MNNVQIDKNGEHAVDEIQQNKFKRFVTPLTDVYELPENFKLEIQVPGIVKENLQIKIENNILTVKGESIKSDENAATLMRETCSKNYFRKFALSNSVDAEKISAELNNGVLTLTLPKREEAKPKTININ